jgi:hypothetical protein
MQIVITAGRVSSVRYPGDVPAGRNTTTLMVGPEGIEPSTEGL